MLKLDGINLIRVSMKMMSSSMLKKKKKKVDDEGKVELALDNGVCKGCQKGRVTSNNDNSKRVGGGNLWIKEVFNSKKGLQEAWKGSVR